MWQTLSSALRGLWQGSESAGGSYRADLHYMRGPGPKRHARHAGLLAVAPAAPRPALSTCYRTPKPPRCPSCAQSMPLIRTTQRFGGLATVHIFECRFCDVVFAREAEATLS